MKTINIGQYIINVDADATRRAYSGYNTPGPERCKCGYCNNWVEARKLFKDESFVDLLSSMGIPYGYEIEVCEVPGKDSPHMYSGWYIFIGDFEVIDGSENHSHEVGPYEIRLSKGLSYPVEEFPKEGVSELHFFIQTQWYLKKQDPNTVTKKTKIGYMLYNTFADLISKKKKP